MNVVMPPLLQSAQLKPDVTITSADSDADIDEDDDRFPFFFFNKILISSCFNFFEIYVHMIYSPLACSVFFYWVPIVICFFFFFFDKEEKFYIKSTKAQPWYT
jgi:hypothetical protein